MFGVDCVIMLVCVVICSGICPLPFFCEIFYSLVVFFQSDLEKLRQKRIKAVQNDALERKEESNRQAAKVIFGVVIFVFVCSSSVHLYFTQIHNFLNL